VEENRWKMMKEDEKGRCGSRTKEIPCVPKSPWIRKRSVGPWVNAIVTSLTIIIFPTTSLFYVFPTNACPFLSCIHICIHACATCGFASPKIMLSVSHHPSPSSFYL